MSNPYLKKKPAGSKPPMLVRLPVHDFEDAHHLESELLQYELCIARIRNPRPSGFTHDVALVYKDDMDRVYSLQMMQHHGELKDTPENRKALFGEGEAKDGKSTDQVENQGKESTTVPGVKEGPGTAGA